MTSNNLVGIENVMVYLAKIKIWVFTSHVVGSL